MEVILFQPEIPQNAGNIARTCALTGTKLTFVRPLGFALNSRQLKRAGLDYWHALQYEIVDDLESCLSENCYFFSTKGEKIYSEISYEPHSKLIFGSESAGLPLEIHEKWKTKFVTIPMVANLRSLNLSNAVAIALYEAYRQQGFGFL